MVYRLELTYAEIADLLDGKYITGSSVVHTWPPE